MGLAVPVHYGVSMYSGVVIVLIFFIIIIIIKSFNKETTILECEDNLSCTYQSISVEMGN